MSNQAQIDNERQFQEDLAKATALSLEQQALDDYRRHKKYGTDYYTQQQQHYQQQQQRNYNISQRRHSEVHRGVSTLGIGSERSRTPPAQSGNDNGNGNSHSNGNGESDLICFASPTGKQPTTTQNETPFERLIEDLQRMQTNNSQTALVPVGPVAATAATAATPAPLSYPAASYASVPPGLGMQLVPYQAAPQPPQQRPLNNEELQRLYSMPNQLALQPVAPPGFVYYSTYTAPVVPGSAAFMPPQYPPHPYGYGYYSSSTHVDLTRPQSTPAVVNSSSSSHSHSTAATPAPSVASFNVRRATPPVGSIPSVGPALPVQRTGNDLIDLDKDD